MIHLRKMCLVPVLFFTLAYGAGSVLSQEGKAVTTTKYVIEGIPVVVHFPGMPKEKDVKGGKQAILSTMGDKAVYFFQYNVLGKEVNVLGDADLAKKILDGARDGALRSLKDSKLLVEKTYLHAGKYPARDLEIAAPAIGIYRTYIVITPTHLYQVVVGGPADFTDALPAKRFLDSLKVTN